MSNIYSPSFMTAWYNYLKDMAERGDSTAKQLLEEMHSTHPLDAIEEEELS
jgi:predicted DNA-binding ribbon-helix-helix protein